ncbi:MAG: sugar ABC transporter permease [Limnochordia bacterium]|jgi:raffinose/stachyose/melibiose transport system permease protein|nr:sugar ABC transporter permease [Limnochordia bacterium]MDI9465053.1 sugar ABC transporter permease [Bacillota bacterium]NLO96172.1 sugar ABC transporter permease [Bacillota bacterium]HOB40788.1 sugar ABC transporter permease [Limnochordia bacterium]HOK31830.1 sugar ABC transporter permease [Limnochordia bacterium]
MKRLLAWWTEERRAYLLLVLPGVLVYWAVMAFPTVFSLGLSMTNYNGGVIFGNPNIQFVGLRHYLRMFNDRYFWISLKNNGLIMAISVFGQIPLGFLFAYVIHRKLIKFGDFFQTIIYLPCVISTIVVGRLWQSFFSPYGPFTKFMQTFQPGWENELAYDPQKAILPVLFVILWMYTGQYMIIFLANLQKIDPSLIEAARIDGASEWQVLTRIMLPALSGVIVTACILAISGSLKSFDLVYAMTAGNPARRTSVLALYMYDTAFKHSPNYPLANSISVFMVLLSFILIVLVRITEARFGGREE